MKGALKLMSYANRLPHNQTNKVMSQLTDRNQIKRIIRNIRTKVRGTEGREDAEPIPLAIV